MKDDLLSKTLDVALKTARRRVANVGQNGIL